MSVKKKLNNNGFTLIEIIVATTILGAALVTIIGLFSGTLRQATISNDYSNALFLAKKKLSEIELDGNYSNRSGSFEHDEFKKYRWELKVSAYSFGNREYDVIRPTIFNAKITVTWKYGKKGKKVELQTLKTVM